MTGTIALIMGILLAAIVLGVVGRRILATSEPPPQPTALGWWTLALGLIAATAFTLATQFPLGNNTLELGLYLTSIAGSFAATIVGAGTLKKRDRHWPTWIGLTAGLVPALAWIAFAAGHIIGPGD